MTAALNQPAIFDCADRALIEKAALSLVAAFFILEDSLDMEHSAHNEHDRPLTPITVKITTGPGYFWNASSTQPTEHRYVSKEAVATIKDSII